MSFFSNIISANYFTEMELPLKRRRAQDDLEEPPRKFSKCHPFPENPHQSYLSPITIYKSNSFHDDLVNDLPTVADKPHPNNSDLLSPTTDKENIDPTTLDRRYNKAARCPWRKPLQEYADIEGNMGIEDDNASTSQKCWVTRDGELYTKLTGPLARSSESEWETSRWMRFRDKDSAGKTLKIIRS